MLRIENSSETFVPLSTYISFRPSYTTILNAFPKTFPIEMSLVNAQKKTIMKNGSRKANEAGRRERKRLAHLEILLFCACPNLLWKSIFSSGTILVPRACRFLVTWLGNEGLWKQPLPDVRQFLTFGRACAEVTNITAHAHNGGKILLPELSPESGFFGMF